MKHVQIDFTLAMIFIFSKKQLTIYMNIYIYSFEGKKHKFHPNCNGSLHKKTTIFLSFVWPLRYDNQVVEHKDLEDFHQHSVPATYRDTSPVPTPLGGDHLRFRDSDFSPLLIQVFGKKSFGEWKNFRLEKVPEVTSDIQIYVAEKWWFLFATMEIANISVVILHCPWSYPIPFPFLNLTTQEPALPPFQAFQSLEPAAVGKSRPERRPQRSVRDQEKGPFENMIPKSFSCDLRSKNFWIPTLLLNYLIQVPFVLPLARNRAEFQQLPGTMVAARAAKIKTPCAHPLHSTWSF